MELHSNLYLDLAREFSGKANALAAGPEKDAFLRTAIAYERAATEMQKYPEAA